MHVNLLGVGSNQVDNYRNGVRSVVAFSNAFLVLCGQSKSKKCSKFVIFSVFSFGYLGGNIYLFNDFVTY